MVNKKQILNIDLDGVCADFDKAILTLDPTIGTLSHSAPNYEERSKRVDALVAQDPEFFEKLELMEGAKSAIETLSNHYEIYFVSTAMWSVPHSFTGKRIWLENNFGEFATKRLVLTHRKDLVIGDYLIDDRIVNGVTNFGGEHIHFGNENFSNWKKTLLYLLQKRISFLKTEESWWIQKHMNVTLENDVKRNQFLVKEIIK